jgi:glycosyltransferase involved in cell wall biosynthesis
MASAAAIYNVIRERRLPYTLDLFGSPLLRSARYPFTANAHGVLEHEKMLSLLRESKVGISFSATNMALLPFEMLMAGCLPIELRSENVLLEAENNNPPIMALADFNPKSVQEQFLWVLSHPAEASAMVERGREFLKSRTWQSVGEHFVKAMLQL